MLVGRGTRFRGPFSIYQDLAGACRRLGGAARDATHTPQSLVLGLGSNCIDCFYPIRAFPAPGDKQYFASKELCSGKVVGGVTLNHLAWARRLGCPTALLALHGNDESGKLIKDKLRALGVDSGHIKVSKAYRTSTSHILSTPDGERTIIMGPASTSQLDAARVEEEFGALIPSCAMVTTEISQVPLSGVQYLLEASREAAVRSLLDLDVTPEVALGPARLGSKAELVSCVTSASVLKLTASAAGELLSLVSRSPLESSLEGMAKQLAEAFDAELCVVTSGSQGAALALGRRSGLEPVVVPVFEGVTQIDATGAGDAFFGALVACIHVLGFPNTSEQLGMYGRIAAAAGAACVEVQGGLPVAGVSVERVRSLAPEAGPLLEAAEGLDAPAWGTDDAMGDPVVSYFESLAEDARALGQLSGLEGDAGEVGKALPWLVAAAPGGTGHHHAYTTGVGKSGLVAARLASSLRSIGVATTFVQGSEWAHGDLGSVRAGDVIIAFSHSGRAAELVELAERVGKLGVHMIAVTGNAASPLARVADVHLTAEADRELIGAIPTRSVIAQEAVSNALVSAVVDASGLSLDRFRASHPGGSIGAAHDAEGS